MTNHLLYLSFGIDVIDGTVTHAIRFYVTALAAGIGGYLTFEGKLLALYLIIALHDVYAPFVVEDAGIVVCATDRNTFKRERT